MRNLQSGNGYFGFRPLPAFPDMTEADDWPNDIVDLFFQETEGTVWGAWPSLPWADFVLVVSAASNHWLRVKGPDKQLQSVHAQILLSVDFLNGLYLSKYLLPTIKTLDLGGDW